MLLRSCRLGEPTRLEIKALTWLGADPALLGSARLKFFTSLARQAFKRLASRGLISQLGLALSLVFITCHVHVYRYLHKHLGIKDGLWHVMIRIMAS